MTASPVTGATRYLTDELLAEVYLAPRSGNPDLAPRLAGRAAPWSRSLAAAPDETAAAVEAALTALMRSTDSLDPDEVRPERLPDSRARAHLEALQSLWRDLDTLPSSLEVTAHVLRSEAIDALEPLPLLDAVPCPHDDPVERALAARLAGHHGQAPDAALAAWTRRQPSRGGSAAGALGAIQRGLGRASDPASPDGTVTFHGLRDPREEANFAAALAQRMLEEGTVAGAAQIGLLCPDDPAYGAALAEAFDHTGLRISGLPAGPGQRDRAGELLGVLLTILEGPAPRTALASLYAAPEMPWPRETGRRMAREIIERGWSRTARDFEGDGRTILDGLKPVGTTEALLARLHAIDAALPALSLAPRIAHLRGAAEGDAPDWPRLRRLAAPRPQAPLAPARFVEGVSLFTETALPWRPARQLIVLGLAGRQWPRGPASDPFFTEGEIDLIRRETGLGLAGRRDKLARGLELFRRQLCAATEGLTCLVPARDLAGGTLPPSTGLALMTHLLGREEPQDLLVDIRAQPRALWPVASTLPPASPAPGLPADGRLDLGSDLLRLREDDEGRFAPQSPSRLETLLVSPFAWVLGELGATDRTWTPETLDVMTLGSVMHHVVETVFSEAEPVPDAAEAEARVPAALEEGLRRNAPWLNGPDWAAERASLLREALEIARAWGSFLRRADARVLHNEVALAGDYGGLLIRGRADCVLELPDGRILVVDHKRASAAKRRDRMDKGWDLQVALYRAMLERPTEDTPLTGMVRNGTKCVTAYHMMRGGTVLAEAAGRPIEGAEMVGQDISVHALEGLAEVVGEVGAGTIRLNGADDAKRFDKERSITAYALKDNALVATFLMPAKEEDEQ